MKRLAHGQLCGFCGRHDATRTVPWGAAACPTCLAEMELSEWLDALAEVPAVDLAWTWVEDGGVMLLAWVIGTFQDDAEPPGQGAGPL